MNRRRFTYRGKISLRKNKRRSYVERAKARKAGADKDVARDVTEKIKERERESGTSVPADHGHPCSPGDLSADRKPEMEDGRRAETKATWPRSNGACEGNETAMNTGNSDGQCSLPIRWLIPRKLVPRLIYFLPLRKNNVEKLFSSVILSEVELYEIYMIPANNIRVRKINKKYGESGGERARYTVAKYAQQRSNYKSSARTSRGLRSILHV